MATSAVSATSATTAANQISIQDFLKILVAQLNNQDPMKPMDNQEFVTQLAQFTSLQQTQEMNTKISSLLTQQATTQSIGLLGRSVDVNSNGTTSTGTVKGLNFVNGEPQLTVNLGTGAVLTNVTLSSIVSIR
jgi:flagellar basal-body rod modification protein FlgD